MKCKKIFSVLSALALVLVSVLPGFVVPVSAEEDPFLSNLEVFDFSECTSETTDYSQISNPPMSYDGYYSRYKLSYTFPESTEYFYGLSIDYFNNRLAHGNYLNFGLYSGSIASVYVSPFVSWRFHNLMCGFDSDTHYVVDLRPFISAGYNCVTFKMYYNFNYSPAYLTEIRSAQYGFYDASGYRVTDPLVEEREAKFSSAGASGEDVVPYNSDLVSIPETAVYMEFYGNLRFVDLTSNSNILIEDFTCELEFHKVDPSFTPGQSTQPTVPPAGGDDSGSGSDSGSGTGSGSSSTTPTYPAFDDSGIIDSVDSAADKIIDEVGSDISNQTDIISGAIGDQTGQIGDMIGGVQDDLEDLNKTQQDLLQESEKTNETLTDTLDEVKSLPEKIMDGIKGLFVPGEEDMQEYNDKWDELLHSRFGALYESVDIISEVGSVFVDTEARNTVDFPSVTIPLAGVDFEFGGWAVQVIPDGFDVLVDMLKGMISLLATVAFVNALRNKFDRLMEGSG